jgi:hypothetical protein
MVFPKNCWTCTHNRQISHFCYNIVRKCIRGGRLKRPALAILLCIFTSGCVSSQIIPRESALLSLRVISVVQIEGTPLVLYPDTPDDVRAIKALMQSIEFQISARERSVKISATSLSRSDAPLGAVSPPRTLGAGAIFELPVTALAGREVWDEAAVIEMGQPDQTWMPRVQFAKTAMEILQQGGKREAKMIDGYVKVPIMDRSITSHMENWLGPIRRLYNSDMSTIDYNTILGPDPPDAVLEVGTLQYEYSIGRLLLTVFVRLVDPHTKQVLGRAKEHSYPKAGPLIPLFENNASGMKNLIVDTGNRLVAQCLAQIGLTSD